MTSGVEVRQAAELFKLPYGSAFLEDIFVGCIYFYRWCNNPTATLLVRFVGREIYSLETRNESDRSLSVSASIPILEEAQRLFRAAGCSLVDFIPYGFQVVAEDEATRH
jgi:hypothetical protein